MTTNHAPAPWVWTSDDAGPEDEYGYRTIGPIDLRTFKSKGYVANPILRDANGEAIVDAGSGEYTPIHGTTPEECAANGFLIAAAPDLLATLEAICEAWRTDDPLMSAAVQRGWEAIAKAKGA